jgi:hypothetical protein
LNTCSCRSVHGVVNLAPLSDQEWSRNWKIWPSAAWGGFAVAMYLGFLSHVVEVDAQRPRWQVWAWLLVPLFRTADFENRTWWHRIMPLRLSPGVMCKTKEQILDDLDTLRDLVAPNNGGESSSSAKSN